MPTIRVATLNVWGRHGDWPSRRHALRAGFHDLAPDVIALQETIVTADYDQVTDILGRSAQQYTILHQSQRTADGVGCSIATRFPVLDADELDLCVTSRVDPHDFPGRSSAVELDTPAGRVLLVNHKPNWQVQLEHERELQAVGAAQFVERKVAGRDVHVVVAGDMDARPESASMRFWTGRQSLQGMSVAYQDAWEVGQAGEPGHTFTSANPLITHEADWSRIPPRRIDYILVRCDDRGPTLRVQSCDRLFADPVDGTWASDHFGVVADLTSDT